MNRIPELALPPVGVRADGVDFFLSPNGEKRLRADLDLLPGETGLLVGANGSGKTAFLELLVGVRRPQVGQVILEPTGPVGFAVQESGSGLFPWYSILRNVTLPATQILPAFDQARIESFALDLLDIVGLSERAQEFPYVLSGGEKQAVNLIRSLLTPAGLFLLDEPFSSLNQEFRTPLEERVSELFGTSTVLMVSHGRQDLGMGFDKFFGIENGVLGVVDKAYVEELI